LDCGGNPRKLELIIDFKTAKAVDCTIPPAAPTKLDEN
jgi:hypothetical protein